MREVRVESTPQDGQLRFVTGAEVATTAPMTAATAGWSFVGNAGIMGLGQVIYVACQWGALITLARFGGPEMVGRFALALAIAAPPMLFSNLALRAALVTDVRGEHPLARYLALRLATTMIGGAIVLGIALCLRLGSELTVLVMAFALAKGCENLSDILYGVAQRHERFDLIARSMSARGLLGLLGLAAGIELGGDVIAGALALALAWALVLVLHDWPMTAKWRRGASAGAGSPRSWLALAWSVLPLGVAALLISLNGNLPRYVIADRFGEAELGVFAAMAYLVVAGSMLINVLGQVATSRLARAASGHDRRGYLHLMGRMLLVALMLGLFGLVVSSLLHRQIMALLYGDAFVTQSSLLVWVMLAAMTTYLNSCLGFGLTALRLFRVAPLIYGLACAANLAMCWLLAPALGPLGVVLAWAGALLANALLNLLANVWGLSRGRTETCVIEPAHHGDDARRASPLARKPREQGLWWAGS
jgi:O-antigen/teichoic acid export membrane protein